MTKTYQTPIYIPPFFSYTTTEQVVADLTDDGWTELYIFPLFLGSERYKPNPEELRIPERINLDVVPCEEQKPLRPMPLRVGKVSRFYVEDGKAYMEFDIDSDEVDMDDPNWEARVEYTPRLNKPRDCVTRIQLRNVPSYLDVHGIHPEIMREPA